MTDSATHSRPTGIPLVAISQQCLFAYLNTYFFLHTHNLLFQYGFSQGVILNLWDFADCRFCCLILGCSPLFAAITGN